MATESNVPDQVDDVVNDSGAVDQAAAGVAPVAGRSFPPPPSRPRRKVWPTIGLATVLTAAGVVAYATLTQSGQRTTQLIGQTAHLVVQSYQTKREVNAHPNLIFEKTGSDHVNILLIGRDVDYKEIFKHGRNFWHMARADTHARSDSMMVLALDREHGVVRMVSLPRDAMVHLPPNDFGVRRGKLNAAHAYGGPKLLEATLQQELGITVHRYAVIKFEGFKRLIDRVGGVWVKVDGALKRDRATGKLYRGNLDYDDNWGNLHIHLKPGLQLLDGQKAHDYVRFRMDLEGDPGRIRRQQAVMRGLAKQMMHVSPIELGSVIQEARKQFLTDMTDTELASAAHFAQSIGDSSKIQPLTLFGVYSTRGQLTLNGPKNRKLLAYVFGPTFNVSDFLPNSPSTHGDEVGVINNANPAAKEVLLKAGVIKSDADLPKVPGLTVPVREEDTSAVVPAEQHHRPHAKHVG